MKNKLLKISWLLPILLLANTTAFGADCDTADNDLGGIVFRDFNENATQDLLEPGFGATGMIIEAYDTDNALVSTANIDADGTYAFAGLGGSNYRFEFKGLPAYIQYGVAGGQSDSGVKFVNTANCDIDFGVNNPSDYCQNNPDLASNCYVPGPQPGDSGDVLVSFPYNAGVPDNANIGLPTHGSVARAFEVGTTYGLAWSQTSQALYAASFQKRFAGYGPGGPAAIYKVDQSGIALMDLDDYFGPDSAGANPHPDGSTDWETDDNGSTAAGKLSFGDMEISDDEATLYVVNLFDKQLYAIPTDVFPPAQGSINTFAIPNPCDNETDFRPGALKFQDNRLYVGITCTAESTVDRDNPVGDPSQLHAYIYQFNPVDNGFTSVFDFPLDYSRECVDVATFADCIEWAPGEWYAWIPGVWPQQFPPQSQESFPSYPQPWFSDIEFDYNGDLILSIRDRFGDQTGNSKTSNPATPDVTNIFSVAGGDILRACVNPVGGWLLEQNGSCGGVTTIPAYPNPEGSGPGNPGQEYYWDEYYSSSVNAPWHAEIIVGGLAQVPGKADVSAAVIDPVLPPALGTLEGGVIWLDNTTGARTHSYRIYLSDTNLNFGKANGLGDLEAMCNAAPIELGNRVWNDSDTDGIQDPGEAGIAGVTVTLTCGADSATVMTGANGEYLFRNSDAGVEFLEAGIACSLTIENSDPELTDLNLTMPNVEGNTSNNAETDVRDSDASESGATSGINNFFIGAAGHNNHSFDFGFSADEPPPVDPVVIPPRPVPTLNEWMLLLMSGLLGLMAVTASRRLQR